MRVLSLLSALSVFVAGVAAESLYTDDFASIQATVGVSLTAANFYGAPIPPWKPQCKPGWYYGNKPGLVKWLIPWLKDDLICFILKLLPLGLRCPKPHPPGGWKQTFSNYTGAIQADDYLTFGLVDTIEDCKTMCKGVEGCNFFNTYRDVNGKDGSPLLTCSLFKKCHTKEDATNEGGQTQPDGSVNYITNSDGYCKI